MPFPPAVHLPVLFHRLSLLSVTTLSEAVCSVVTLSPPELVAEREQAPCLCVCVPCGVLVPHTCLWNEPVRGDTEVRESCAQGPSAHLLGPHAACSGSGCTPSASGAGKCGLGCRGLLQAQTSPGRVIVRLSLLSAWRSRGRITPGPLHAPFSALLGQGGVRLPWKVRDFWTSHNS